MEEQATEAVNLERVRRDAACIIIRVGLGTYILEGPQDNILVPESHVAWATVVHDLQGEGYEPVTVEEYAAVTGMAEADVRAGIHERGNLFAVRYHHELVVPLPQKRAVLPEIAV